jgi:hypothetical protein
MVFGWTPAELFDLTLREFDAWVLQAKKWGPHGRKA